MIRDSFRPFIQHSSSPQKLCNTLSTAELTSWWLKYPEERKVLVRGCPGPTWPIFGWKSLSPNPLPCLCHRLDRTLPARAVGALLWRCLKLCDRRSRAIYVWNNKEANIKKGCWSCYYNYSFLTLTNKHYPRSTYIVIISKLLTKFGMFLKLSVWKIKMSFHQICVCSLNGASNQ